MLETNEFFQDQIQKCERLASGAVGKSEREFWLGLANRWRELLRARQPGVISDEGSAGLKTVRSGFAKRSAA
jgi:hypothetical protein